VHDLHGLEVLGRHHQGPRHLYGEHRQQHLAEADDVAVDERRALDRLAVHGDAVGAPGVADRDPLGSRFDHGVAPRAASVVEDEVARGVAPEDGDGAGELDFVRLSGRVPDLESHDIP
jgi:hypothetical protein